MNVIVVDDEPLALRGIGRLVREALEGDGGAAGAGANAVADALPAASAADAGMADAGAAVDIRLFSLSREALAFARERRVDVAFLDIEMPGMGGLALAKALKDIDPDAHIVFVTSYERYAVDAFSVHATGYLLKPARLEDVRRELAFIGDDLRRRDAHVGAEGASAAGSRGSWYAEGADGRRVGGEPCDRSRKLRKVRVRTFGGFEAEVGGVPLSFKRSKSKELLALLIDRRGCGVTTREACAVLWEDAPYSASQRSYFQNVVADLRAALTAAGAEAALVRSRNSLAIDPALIDSDSYRFLEGDPVAVNAYRGDYLPAYSWAEYSVGSFSRVR
ncbi:hypothetical protein B5F40_04785 [Gordonibacter sp. An230]|uniref:response regulator n=1 Tax=Gordonibacter sp. An230 TaxID=1965592 RepID=UPI000B54AEC0|nr:response regulator [Gordonibacter sp. An230]OUO91103.1 hypothetical protein B5F40_04785 [Gordonibacter sp. An230]